MKSARLTRFPQTLRTTASCSSSKQTQKHKMTEADVQTSKQKAETNGGFHLRLKAFPYTQILHCNINTNTPSTSTNTADPDRGGNGRVERCKEQQDTDPGVSEEFLAGNLAGRALIEGFISDKYKYAKYKYKYG